LVTFTLGKFLEAKQRLFEISSTIKRPSLSSFFLRKSTKSLVFGFSILIWSDKKTLFSFARDEKMDRMADLYIFLFSFFGFADLVEAGNTTPPPRQRGLLDVPALALPVPFWRQGFFPPPLTADLFFWAFVPGWLFSI